MKPYTLLTLIIAAVCFFAVATAIKEDPSKSKQDETIHILPLVEDMATANPLQF